MACRSLIVQSKGLERVTFNLNAISKAVEQLHKGSNCPDNSSPLHVFLISFSLRLQNIRLKDLNMAELNSVNERNTKYIILLMFSLLIEGKAAKTVVYQLIGIDKRTALKLLNLLIGSGYIREFEHKIRYTIPYVYHRSVIYTQLTSKGQDKLTYIISKVIDQRLL